MSDNDETDDTCLRLRQLRIWQLDDVPWEDQIWIQLVEPYDRWLATAAKHMLGLSKGETESYSSLLARMLTAAVGWVGDSDSSHALTLFLNALTDQLNAIAGNTGGTLAELSFTVYDSDGRDYRIRGDTELASIFDCCLSTTWPFAPPTPYKEGE